MKKPAVIFPGIGYTSERPLLYYAAKNAKAAGYELIYIDHSGLEWNADSLNRHRSPEGK